MHISVCNGDADGLCAVLQWCLFFPATSDLVTGLKRDVELLQHVQPSQGDQVLVCDISMQRNYSALMRLLDAGVLVRYFDHHHVDNIPKHPLLEAHIDFSSDTCTSLLMNRHLNGACSPWAVVGAFGDNLTQVADRLAAAVGLHHGERRRLQSLGEAINYNAYGDSKEDVYIQPAQLFARMLPYRSPLDFLDHEEVGHKLDALRQQDMQLAKALPAYFENTQSCVYLLPDKPWSRRVMGSLGNALANAEPRRAHALLRANSSTGYTVSVRAPLVAPVGAASLCQMFGGDGRAASAGIDHLPPQQVERFLGKFSSIDWTGLK